MKTVKIREPIWNTKSIGIAEWKLSETTYIEIIYKDKFGNRSFPHIYKITRSRAVTFPSSLRKGTQLRIIPIFELEVHEYKEAKCVRSY